MEIPEDIKRRKSVRAFLDRQLQPGDAEKLVEAATLAPSAGNMQPWAFVSVTGEEAKQRLVEASHGQSWMFSAPLVLVVCADPSRNAARYGERGASLYCLQDTAAAVENILLTAVHNGLGGCWMGAFDEEKVSQVLGLPLGVRPVAMVPVGYPAQDPAPRPRRPVSEVLHKEKWQS